nr:helix-turn-helix domain-containing protein [Lysobacter sp.]
GCLKSRILGHLRELHEATGCKVIAVSHQELGEELGATREAVSRTLKQMERSGDVRLGRRSISLVAVSPEVSTPAPRDGSPSAMDTRRLRESFEPKFVPQRKQPDPRPEVAGCKPADPSDDAPDLVQPNPADPLPRITTQAPQRTVFRSL